jgi:hypothetical protein
MRGAVHLIDKAIDEADPVSLRKQFRTEVTPDESGSAGDKVGLRHSPQIPDRLRGYGSFNPGKEGKFPQRSGCGSGKRSNWLWGN